LRWWPCCRFNSPRPCRDPDLDRGPGRQRLAQAQHGSADFLALARPPTISFLAAIERIPLGTAVAIEFVGPLTVAAVRSHNKRALPCPTLALLGVVLLTEPWQGEINSAGIGFAAFAAIGWATYILLTQQIGDRLTGLGGLTITVLIAAVTAAIAGIPKPPAISPLASSPSRPGWPSCTQSCRSRSNCSPFAT
jgi:threonine/homoserine efflux transporter RhtA